MAGEVYSIKIRLDVDDSQLNAAMANAQAAQGRGGNRYYAGRSVRQAAAYRNRRAGLTTGQRGAVAALTRMERSGYGGLVSAMGARVGFQRLNRSWTRLSRDFSSNLFSINGFRRNLGNFTSVLGNVGGLFAKSIPVLNAAGAGLGAFLAAKYTGPLLSGGIMLAGKKILMGDNIQKAAVDTMQFNVAKNFMGPAYDEAYRRANEIAAMYGYDRAGIMNTATTLSNLRLSKNGKALGANKSIELAGILGKVSQYSGADYNRIAINLQQMLSQPTVSARDSRELIQQAQIVSTIAQQQMLRKSGKIISVQDYFKNKNNILDVLYEFDQKVQSHPIMKMRGSITLSKQNLWMEIANSGQAFFQDISDAVVSFNTMLQSRLAKYLNTYTPGSMKTMMEQFTESVGSLMDGIVNVIPKIVKILTFLNQNSATVGFGVGGTVLGGIIGGSGGALIGAGLGAVLGWTVGGDEKRRQIRLMMEKYDSDIYAMSSSIMGDLAKKTGTSVETLAKENPNLERTILTKIISETKWDKPQTLPGLKQLFGANPIMGPTLPNLSSSYPEWIKSIEDMKKPIDNVGTGDGDDMKDILDAMTGTRRSLTINFNKEIVSMPTNIRASDVSDIKAQLLPEMEMAITSGLTRALTTAGTMS